MKEPAETAYIFLVTKWPATTPLRFLGVKWPAPTSHRLTWKKRSITIIIQLIELMIKVIIMMIIIS